MADLDDDAALLAELADDVLRVLHGRVEALSDELHEQAGQDVGDAFDRMIRPVVVEVERRQQVLAHAQIDIELAGHLTTPHVDHQTGQHAAVCTCEWRAPADDLDDAERLGRDHAEPLGGAWGDLGVLARLWGGQGPP